MEWNAFSLELELTSALHCGDMPIGFVARTFPYVPCHIPFFAMVPAAVRALDMPDERPSYAAVEKLFENKLRCTPLYILDDGGDPLFPWEEESRLKLEHAYLSSSYGVSLDNGRRSAIDGCLYETEVILERGRKCQKPTRLSGALFIRPNEHAGLGLAADGAFSWNGRQASLQSILEAMRLGGDRSRSLGRPAIPAIKTLKDKERLWAKYEVDLNGNFPALFIPQGEAGPLPAKSQNDGLLEGPRVVLTGRRHKGTGFGEDMDKAVPAFAPGWKAAEETRAELACPRCACVTAR